MRQKYLLLSTSHRLGVYFCSLYSVFSFGGNIGGVLSDTTRSARENIVCAGALNCESAKMVRIVSVRLTDTFKQLLISIGV